MTATTVGGALGRPRLRPGHRLIGSTGGPSGWRTVCECGATFRRSGTGDRYLALRDYQDHAYEARP